MEILNPQQKLAECFDEVKRKAPGHMVYGDYRTGEAWILPHETPDGDWVMVLTNALCAEEQTPN